MEKKLYRVKVVLYVMAENESDACLAATQARFDIFECSARKADHLDPGWENAIPYNSDDHHTCRELLADQQQFAVPMTQLIGNMMDHRPRSKNHAHSMGAGASLG